MMAAPACFIVADSLWPVSHTKAADVLADATGSMHGVYAGMVFGFIGFVFMVGAILGLAHMLHERSPGLAMAGAGIAMVGVLAICGAICTQGLVLFEAAQPGRDAAAMTDLLHDMMQSAAPMLLLTFGLSVGVLVLTVGLARTHVVATWSVACVALAAIGLGIGQPFALQAVNVIADIVLLAGLGSIGYTVLAETDEEWEHTPEFHGFARPAMG